MTARPQHQEPQADPALMPDTDAAVAFLREVHAGRTVHLTAIHPADGILPAGSFAADNTDGMRRWIDQHQGIANVYWSVNPLRRAPFKKAKKEDVARMAFVHVDLDPQAGETTEAAKARCQKLLDGYRLPPSIVVDSGNGLQALWALRAVGDELEVGGDVSRAEELERTTRQLQADFDQAGGNKKTADATFNLDRVLRVPGTINVPNDKKRAAGRVPALARLLKLDLSLTYELGEFGKAPPLQATPTGAANDARPAGPTLPMGTAELMAWAAEHGRQLPDRALARIADGDAGEHDGDRSAMVIYVCAALDRAGVPLVMIASAVFDRANLISAHVQEKGKPDTWGYAWRQATRGRELNAQEQARRAAQAEENRRIGEGDTVPTAELIDLETALRRFVFCEDGSRVVDLDHPHYDLALVDWTRAYAASVEEVARPPKKLAGGVTKEQAPELVPVCKLWMSHPDRRRAVSRTFKADGPLMLNDPEGRLAVNSWRPFDRSLHVLDSHAAGLGLFLDHVAFLFGAEADRFLDWLAHIEQKPGELPHTAWLHIARRFGMGRNWLGSVLTRVWAGSVAANFDLMATLDRGYNGRLSRKVLAIVDEIREGGSETWRHSQTLKRIVNEEYREINPKYGRQFVEFNACRWLMFSNYTSAIPVEKGDRRIEVVACEAEPRGADYYGRLYQALSDPQFIAAVAGHFGQRDLSGFNPGAHAKATGAKLDVIRASQSEADEWCELIVKHWPADVASNPELAAVLLGEGSDAESRRLEPRHKRSLEQAGIVSFGADPIHDSETRRSTRVSIVRNKARWAQATVSEVRAELARGRRAKADAAHSDAVVTWRELLERRAAGEADQPKDKPPF